MIRTLAAQIKEFKKAEDKSEVSDDTDADNDVVIEEPEEPEEAEKDEAL